MEAEPRPTERLSLRAAACALAGDDRDALACARVRSSVDAQLRRAGVEAQDADDVRTEVVLALLCAPAAELALPLELVCARAAAMDAIRPSTTAAAAPGRRSRWATRCPSRTSPGYAPALSRTASTT
jgi:hypothetical protein